MKNSGMFLFICFSVISIGNSVFAQDDETRQATGLPMMIGENATNRNKGNLSGKITLQGQDTSQPRPIIMVTALVNGVMVGKRQAADTGNYFIQGVPRENVTVIVEVNGEEVGRQQLMPTIMGNIRQDFVINIAQWKTSKNKTGVISAKDLYPRSPENEKLFEKAISAAQDKKSDEAVKFFKQIVKNDEKDFIAWTQLGNLYFLNEKLKEAAEAYTKAIEQKPDYMLPRLNLGKVQIAQKELETAITTLTKVVETEPTSPDANHLLGEAYLQAKKGSKAVGYLNEAIRLSPIEKAEIHLRLAALYNGANLKDRAVLEFKQFLEKVPKYEKRGELEKYIKENSPK